MISNLRHHHMITNILNCLFALLVSASTLAAAIGTVAEVEGQPYLLRKFKKLPLTLGLQLEARDNLYTKTGKATLLMEDGSEIFLGQDSHFKVKSYVTSGQDIQRDVLLFGGTSRFKVKSLDQKESFTVRSPSAVAGVRGTDFNVNVPKSNLTTVTVFSGLVACYSVQPEFSAVPELVEAGFATRLEQNKAPSKAFKVSTQQLNATKSSTSTAEQQSSEESSDANNNDNENMDTTTIETPEQQTSVPDLDLDSVKGDIIQSTVEQIQERVIEEQSHDSSLFDSILPVAPPTDKE